MFELTVARRHILANRKDTILNLLSVAIAVGVIKMSLVLNEGSKEDIVTSVMQKNPHILLSAKGG